MFNKGKRYNIQKEILIHTKPEITTKIILFGEFKKETKSYFVFDAFRVKKDCLKSYEEVKDESNGN